MHQVNALTIRNRLGEVLELLEADGKPILISKGRKVRAVLVSVEDFKKRFVDVQAEEEKERFLKAVRQRQAKKTEELDSVELLRDLRGYTE
jgi:prevent-host-death family protein